jgi:hypothetical protein
MTFLSPSADMRAGMPEPIGDGSKVDAGGQELSRNKVAQVVVMPMSA